MCQPILTLTVGSMKTNAFRIILTKERQVNGKLNFSCKSFCLDTPSILQANYCKGGTKCVQRIITQIWFLSQQFPFFLCVPCVCHYIALSGTRTILYTDWNNSEMEALNVIASLVEVIRRKRIPSILTLLSISTMDKKSVNHSIGLSSNPGGVVIFLFCFIRKEPPKFYNFSLQDPTVFFPLTSWCDFIKEQGFEKFSKHILLF